MPAWLAIERSVIAFCSRSTPTSVGGIARAAGQPSAIAMPAPTASARYGHTSVVPDELTSARPTLMHAANSSEPAKISRRGTRSASCPAGSASTNSGTNSASPIQPRSSALRCRA